MPTLNSRQLVPGLQCALLYCLHPSLCGVAMAWCRIAPLQARRDTRVSEVFRLSSIICSKYGFGSHAPPHILPGKRHTKHQRKPAHQRRLGHDALHARRSDEVGRDQNAQADEDAQNTFEQQLVVGLRQLAVVLAVIGRVVGWVFGGCRQGHDGACGLAQKAKTR